jgi:uridine kinase
MKVIAIGGEPGAGKSTLMKRLIEEIRAVPKYNEYKLVPYLQYFDIFILGKYEEGEVFSGTDRMSMAVQPEAVKFLAWLPENAIVLFEGDRLFNNSFLEHCNENYDTKIIYLKTTKDIRTERYKDRGSNQNETWLRGRESKINNILTNMTLMFITETFENNTLDQQNEVYERILDYVHKPILE